MKSGLPFQSRGGFPKFPDPKSVAAVACARGKAESAIAFVCNTVIP